MKHKSLLSQLSKGVQKEVREDAALYARLLPPDVQDAELTFQEHLAALWNWEALYAVRNGGEERIDKQIADFSELFPGWPRERVKVIVAFSVVVNSWGGFVARRILREDPAEIGIAYAISRRLWWQHKRIMDGGPPATITPCNTWMIVHALAMRDYRLAQTIADYIAQSRLDLDKEAAHFQEATLAAFRRDYDALRSAMTGVRPTKYNAWVAACLQGIADRSPDQVAQGLVQLLEAERTTRDSENFGVTNLSAHGMYRLCEWVSPDLVSRFAVAEAFPWDAAYHAWLQEHENHLAGLDLNSISPILHEAAVELRLPADWPVPAPAEVEPPMSICQLVLTSAGPNPNSLIPIIEMFARVPKAQVKEWLGQCPVALLSGVSRLGAWMMKRELEKQGASAEIRKPG
jgi:hypothetical protein